MTRPFSDQGKTIPRAGYAIAEVSHLYNGIHNLQIYFPCQVHARTTEEEEGNPRTIDMKTMSMIPLMCITM